METSSITHRLSSRFVAGDTLDDAMRVARDLNSEGILATLDHLGENVTSLPEAAESRDVCLRTLDRICREAVQATVSIKLTQFGLDFSESECRANVEQLVRQAAELGNFVRVDMESSAYTERTIGLVVDLFDRYRAVGTVIQSYLYRSRGDVEMLCRKRIRVRLCKGAYLEPRSAAWQRKSEVDGNFVSLMKLLLDEGTYPAIATHDERMIRATEEYADARGVPKSAFEFQMLYGIRRDIQRRLVAEGYRLRLYVPFGLAWYPYFMRRLAERPANVLFLARNLFRQ